MRFRLLLKHGDSRPEIRIAVHPGQSDLTGGRLGLAFGSCRFGHGRIFVDGGKAQRTNVLKSGDLHTANVALPDLLLYGRTILSLPRQEYSGLFSPSLVFVVEVAASDDSLARINIAVATTQAKRKRESQRRITSGSDYKNKERCK